MSEWLEQVDRVLLRRCEQTHESFPGQPWAEWYAEGWEAEAAADEALLCEALLMVAFDRGCVPGGF